MNTDNNQIVGDVIGGIQAIGYRRESVRTFVGSQHADGKEVMGGEFRDAYITAKIDPVERSVSVGVLEMPRGITPGDEDFAVAAQGPDPSFIVDADGLSKAAEDIVPLVERFCDLHLRGDREQMLEVLDEIEDELGRSGWVSGVEVIEDSDDLGGVASIATAADVLSAEATDDEISRLATGDLLKVESEVDFAWAKGAYRQVHAELVDFYERQREEKNGS